MNLTPISIRYVPDGKLPEGLQVVPFELDFTNTTSISVFTASIQSVRAHPLSCIKGIFFQWTPDNTNDVLQVQVIGTGQVFLIPAVQTAGFLPLYLIANDTIIFSKLNGNLGGSGQFGLTNFTVDPYIYADGVAGGGGGSYRFQFSEIPGGTPNGALTTFTLQYAPNPPYSLQLFRNGLKQSQVGASPDYSLSGATITFTNAPLAGDTLEAGSYAY